MTVPYEVTASDMSRLFIPEGECNGQGSRHVIDGAITRIHPCFCEVCEGGKAERKKAWDEADKRIKRAKEKLAYDKETKLANYSAD